MGGSNMIVLSKCNLLFCQGYCKCHCLGVVLKINTCINNFKTEISYGFALLTVADPGFPVGEGADLRCVHFSAKTYAKTKEMDPVGGGGGRAGSAPVDPPMISIRRCFLRLKRISRAFAKNISNTLSVSGITRAFVKAEG